MRGLRRTSHHSAPFRRPETRASRVVSEAPWQLKVPSCRCFIGDLTLRRPARNGGYGKRGGHSPRLQGRQSPYDEEAVRDGPSEPHPCFPLVNRHQKSGRDAGEWVTERNRCWFAGRRPQTL